MAKTTVTTTLCDVCGEEVHAPKGAFFPGGIRIGSSEYELPADYCTGCTFEVLRSWIQLLQRSETVRKRRGCKDSDPLLKEFAANQEEKRQ